MKNFSEKIKDILYSSIDYIIMLAIIGAVVLIIGWRLDILFQKDVIASTSNDKTKIEEPIKVEKPKEIEKDNKENVSQDIIEPEEDIKNIEVRIPEGSFPGQIASILESNGLIESSTDFINKAVDLQLDTKLKSGVFTISDNASLEKIVKIIAKEEPSN